MRNTDLDTGKMRIDSVALLFFLLTLLAPATVLSQAWLEDRDDKEGPGFKLGDSLVLHLGLGFEGGYDSNATFLNEPVSAGRIRVTPYVDIATRSAQRTEAKEGAAQSTPPNAIFRFGFATFYERYFSRDKVALENLNSRFNPIGFDSHLNFTLLPERKVSIIGGVTYIKTLEPYETNADAQSKHNIVPMAGLRFMPGGGTLTIESKYRLNLIYFSDKSVGADSNRATHELNLSTNWKVFPQTALISNVLFSPVVYYGDTFVNSHSYPLRSWFGMQGLLLAKFGFRVLAGYGAGFYAYGPNFEGLIGNVALMFFLSHFAKATIGAKRDFVDSFYGNYYVMNGGYVTYEHMFFGRLLLSAEASLYKRIYASYSGFVESDTYTVQANTSTREDLWINLSMLGEFRAMDWLSFHLSWKLWKDVTDFASEFTDLESGETVRVKMGFTKFEIFAGVRVHY